MGISFHWLTSSLSSVLSLKVPVNIHTPMHASIKEATAVLLISADVNPNGSILSHHLRHICQVHFLKNIQQLLHHDWLCIQSVLFLAHLPVQSFPAIFQMLYSFTG
jgi:hypothetical protein